MRKKHEIETCFAERDRLSEARTFFLVGIGGAGMMGVAQMLLDRGYRVLGSDQQDSGGLAELRLHGADIVVGHSGEGLEPGMAVILTDAIDLGTSPEVRRARELGLPLFRRSQALGWLLRGRKVVAVTGTHGKTSTTGMIGAALIQAGLDPLVVVGADVPELGGSVVHGQGSWAVVEACEAYDSFHDIDPDWVLLTNLEPDHLDYHGTYEDLQTSVARFAGRACEGLIYCQEDPGAVTIASRFEGRVEWYDRETFGGLSGLDEPLASPGTHNRINAGGALLACKLVGADVARSAQAIAQLRGASRRLQVLREGALTVIDDYAHHPTEVRASIDAIRAQYPGWRLIVVFQPHLYSRTRDFLAEFAEALSGADLVVLTDIYAAREDPIPGVSASRIAELVRAPVRYVPSRHHLPRIVRDLVREPWPTGTVVVGMGAGNIGDFPHAFLDEVDRSGPVRVCVLYGGDSAEREVSLHSGRAVAAALKLNGYRVEQADMTELLQSTGDLSRFLGRQRPDVAFLAVHGTHAEDGALQGLLELLQIPYTGSGVQSSALAMDKDLTKQILRSRGIPVPNGVSVRQPVQARDLPPPLCDLERWVVKPNAQGSTVGLTFVERPSDLPHAIEVALSYDNSALVEEWVQGVEVSVPVLGTRALPVVEIVPATGRYDFASKYVPGATEEICPARISESATACSQRWAVEAHQALGCRGATRTDMLVDGERVVVLEINTLPGMTATSLLPRSAQAAGLSFEDLCDWMVKDALQANSVEG